MTFVERRRKSAPNDRKGERRIRLQSLALNCCDSSPRIIANSHAFSFTFHLRAEKAFAVINFPNLFSTFALQTKRKKDGTERNAKRSAERRNYLHFRSLLSVSPRPARRSRAESHSKMFVMRLRQELTEYEREISFRSHSRLGLVFIMKIE